MARAFASKGDMAEKTSSFTEVGDGLYAFTAEGDPNSGVIIGDDSVMIIEAQATPRLAQKVIDCVRWFLNLKQLFDSCFELVTIAPASPKAPRFFPGKKLKVLMSLNVPTCFFFNLAP